MVLFFFVAQDTLPRLYVLYNVLHDSARDRKGIALLDMSIHAKYYVGVVAHLYKIGKKLSRLTI